MPRCDRPAARPPRAVDTASAPGAPARCGDAPAAGLEAGPLAHFARMIETCYEYASAEHARGRPVVGIMCEYTPREMILAAGAVPVCLCGGSAETIPPAEEDLPANLCPLIKSTYGYHKEKANPFLEMASLLVAETTCDGKKKMYELMARSRPMYVLELPQKPDDPDARAHWMSELRKFRAELRRRFGTEVTEQRLREAIGQMNRERALRRRLAGVMRSERPPLTGRQLIEFKSSICCMPEDLRQYQKALDLLEGVEGPPERAECTRVLLTGVPIVHGAERVLEILEDAGGLVVCLDNCTGVKPILEDVEESAADPVEALAEKYLRLPCSVMTPNARRLETLRRLAREYRPDCVIELVWQACLTYDVESALVRQLVEDELHLPYLMIQTDYSPSDSARITVRVEALFETVRGRRGGRRAGAP